MCCGQNFSFYSIFFNANRLYKEFFYEIKISPKLIFHFNVWRNTVLISFGMWQSVIVYRTQAMTSAYIFEDKLFMRHKKTQKSLRFLVFYALLFCILYSCSHVVSFLPLLFSKLYYHKLILINSNKLQLAFTVVSCKLHLKQFTIHVIVPFLICQKGKKTL